MAPRISSEVKGKILGLLEATYSYSVIINILKKEGVNISKATISRVANDDKCAQKKEEKGKGKRGRPSQLSPTQRGTLLKWLKRINPPTQRAMAMKLGVNRNVIRYWIKKLNFKCVKKPKKHAFTDRVRQLRLRRTWPLYLQLRNGRWKKFITSDEALFTLENTTGQRKIQYISRTKKQSEANPLQHVSRPAGVMVWIGMSSRGLTKPLFVKPKAKINSDYYQKYVLPHMVKEATRLYPEKNYIFQQDSAPAHKAKSTISWLQRRGIAFITPHQWPPSSPDLAPCDYFLWGYLKNKLQERKVTSIPALKSAIRREVRKVPLTFVKKALSSWPKRCRKVYHAKGGHI